MKSCPEDSDDYSSATDITSRSQSTGINWYNQLKHLYFTSGKRK